MVKIRESFTKSSGKTNRTRKCSTLKRTARSGALQLHHLPDDILRRILSRLTFRESSQMRLLSCKWQRLWRTCCSKVIFTRSTMFQPGNTSIRRTRTNFVRRVNSILRQLCSPCNLTKFIVKFGLRRKHTCHVNRWVCFCASSGARHITLDFTPGSKGNHMGFADDKYIFPLHVFGGPDNSFAHIKSLHLGYVCLNPATASFACFSNLKKLTMHKVSFLGGHLCLQDFTALEWLTISYCSLAGLTANQPLHCLWYLRLHYCYLSKIELEAPNLTTFALTNRPIPFALSDDSHKVVEASINLTCRGTTYGDNLDYIYTKLPAALPHVQKLSVTSKIFIFDELQGFAKTSTRFINLTHLTLSLPLCGDNQSIGGILRLAYLLELAPALEELELHFYWYGVSFGQTLRGDMVPYRHDKLKRVLMSGACSWVGLIELAYYILRSASKLECMIIDPVHRDQGPPAEGWMLNRGRQMTKRLLERDEFQSVLTIL